MAQHSTQDKAADSVKALHLEDRLIIFKTEELILSKTEVITFNQITLQKMKMVTEPQVIEDH
jgi:hypothetical protein